MNHNKLANSFLMLGDRRSVTRSDTKIFASDALSGRYIDKSQRREKFFELLCKESCA